MNGIVKSWLDSLKVFIPGNFKLFFLVTLKSFFEGSKVFLKYFWWLIAAWIGVVLYPVLLPDSSLNMAIYITTSFLAILMSFFWIASIRPSVGIKLASYFVKYIRHLIVIGLALLLYMFAGMALFYVVGLALLVNIAGLLAAPVISASITLILLFILFFFLETDGSLKALFKSVKRGAWFFVFNIPGLFVLELLFIGPIFLVKNYMSFDYFLTNANALAVSFLLVLLFAFIRLCFLHNYFIKRVHDHSELYYS